jgi:ATP-dependent protease ClpP protease subunit
MKRHSSSFLDDEDGDSDGAYITRVGALVTFFSPVTVETSGRLMKLLHEASDLILSGRREENPHSGFVDGCIQLNICSDGGDAQAGLTLHDMIANLGIRVRAVVCGSCCSAATLILFGATERCMLQHSFLMIHDVQSSVIGSRREIAVDLKNTSMISNAYRDIYLARCSMPLDVLEKELLHDGLIDAKRAFQLGLIDRILGSAAPGISKKISSVPMARVTGKPII